MFYTQLFWESQWISLADPAYPLGIFCSSLTSSTKMWEHHVLYALPAVARLKCRYPLLLLEQLNWGRKKTRPEGRVRGGKEKSQSIHVLIAFGTACSESRPWPYTVPQKKAVFVTQRLERSVSITALQWR